MKILAQREAFVRQSVVIFPVSVETFIEGVGTGFKDFDKGLLEIYVFSFN